MSCKRFLPEKNIYSHEIQKPHNPATALCFGLTTVSRSLACWIKFFKEWQEFTSAADLIKTQCVTEGGSQQEDPWFEFCWGRAFLCRFWMSSPCICGVRVLWFPPTIKTCTQGWVLSQCPWARHWLQSRDGPFVRMFTTAPLRWVKCRVPASLCSLCTILHCIICVIKLRLLNHCVSMVWHNWWALLSCAWSHF